MFESVENGDEVRIQYISSRSNNFVNRNGEVIQKPSKNKNTLFIRSGEKQLTGIKSGKVYSVTIDDGLKNVGRNTYIGKFDSITKI